jgi:hypothetical protein
MTAGSVDAVALNWAELLTLPVDEIGGVTLVGGVTVVG